jgi:hypothetical protein
MQFGGEANRGFHHPIRGLRVTDLPRYTHDLIARPDYTTGEVAWPFTSLIYLHGSSCESDIGLTLTLAHELQHFFQYAYEKTLWAANQLLINLHADEFKVWWDFPIEIQARATSERVAEEFFGKEAVREHISGKIAAHITDNDAEDWKFVQALDFRIPGRGLAS